MPTAPLKPCNKPRCRELTSGRYCEAHTKQVRQQQDKERPTAAQRGYDSAWRKVRAIYLKANPLCVKCQAKGIVKAASIVDHIIPHKGDSELFNNQSNLQSLCKRCHDVKTATQDGGFGRECKPCSEL